MHQVPNTWNYVRLGNIFSHNTGKALNSANKDGKLLTYITTSNVYWNRLELDHLKEMRFTDSEIEKYTAYKGDLLVCEGGDIGRAAIWTKDEPIRIQNHIHRLRPYYNVNVMFYYYIFYYYKIIGLINGNGIGLQGLSSNKLDAIIVPILSIKEQNRIIDELNKTFNCSDKIEDEKKKLSSIVSLTKSKILDLAIRGKLVPQNPDDEPAAVLLQRIRAEKEGLIKQGKIKRDKKESVIYKGDDNSYYEKFVNGTVKNISDEIPFSIPDNWIWCRGYSCFTGMESLKPSGEFFDYLDIESIDNKLHQIRYSKHLLTGNAPSRANRAVKNGSVLFSLVRPYLENIAFVDSEYSHCIASTGFYVCNSNGLFLPEFMFYLMISKYVIDGLNQFMKGDNSPSITTGNIEKWLYPVPPIAEQKIICNKVENALLKVNNIDKRLN